MPAEEKTLYYLCLQATREGQASHAHVHEIIKGLKKRGWYVKLFEPIYASSSKPLPGPIGRLLEFMRIQMIMVFDILVLSLTRKKVIVYIRSHFAALPTTLFCKIFKIPVVQEVNGPYEDLFIAWPWSRKFKSFFKLILRLQYKLSDVLIAVTQGLKTWLNMEVGDRSCYVIPNGANVELFKPGIPLEIKLPRPYIVFFGSLAPWHGIETMLSAINDECWPEELYLVIVGDGVERSKIENAAKSNERIIFLGKLAYQDMPKIISNGIIGLSVQNNSSHVNTGLFPLKLFETLACGIPVIVSDIPGQADLVKQHDCGIVIQPNDAKSLAKAVNYLYNNPEIRRKKGDNGLEVILNYHSWDKRAEDTNRILLQIQKKKY